MILKISNYRTKAAKNFKDLYRKINSCHLVTVE